MAEPIDSAWLLDDVSALLQEQYMPGLHDQVHRVGKTTNRLIKPSKRKVGGDGINIHFGTYLQDSMRFDTEPLADFAAPDSFGAQKLKVRFDQDSASTNDFSAISGSFQFSDIDRANAGDGAVVDIVERGVSDLRADYDYKLALHRNIGRSALLGKVNGTPKQDDDRLFANASSSATNTTGARFPVDNGSIGYFRPGMRLDIYNGASLVAGNVRVDHVNYTDGSVGVAFNDSSSHPSRQSSGDLSNVADNHDIYVSGERNKGMYSVGEWFTTPTSGESWIGGVDRSASGNRYLVPHLLREGATSAKIKSSMLDDAGNAMSYDMDEGDGVAIVTDPKLHTSLRQSFGEAAFVQIPEGDSRVARFANLGSIGLNYQHPRFGMVKVVSDPLAPADRVRILATNTWESLNYGFQGLQFMPGTRGIFTRMPSANAARGYSKIWVAQGYALCTDICLYPHKNAEIQNVKP